MQTFLSKVVSDVLFKNKDLASITFVLPSKRAGLFLKNELKSQIKQASFIPQIKSIEDFIIPISGLRKIEKIPLIFEFYSVYQQNTSKKNQDSFDTFSKWATILLQDFNEIDQNLIDAEQILSYINDTKRIENWNVNQDNSDLTTNYLKFFDKIKLYYTQLYKHLLVKKLGYSGMMAKEALHNIDSYILQEEVENHTYIFAGFNALNSVEEKIIQKLLSQNLAKIYWDTDTFHFENNTSASYFIKSYTTSWNHYLNHKINWLENNFDQPKSIQIIGVPKSISQCKITSEILSRLQLKNTSLQNTALVLGNEQLLPVMLNSLPKSLQHVNITMGYDLKNIPLSQLFENIFKLHLNYTSDSLFYFKDVLAICNHPSLQLLQDNDNNFQSHLNKLIYKDNILFLSFDDIKNCATNHTVVSSIITLIFKSWQVDIDEILSNFIKVANLLQKAKPLNTLDKEYILRFELIFQQLINLNNKYKHITNLKALYIFYKQILNTEKLSFQGEPLQGLQIMGLLESRVLDFENVILTSTNEGVIPTANQGNSFIPFDIKIEKGLPTYKEKDAVFAYHFYKLLQRAKNVYLIYNTENDDFGAGEKSRFITELEIFKKNNTLKNIVIESKMVVPQILIDSNKLQIINKSEPVLQSLKELAVQGFSPSSLNLYVRNPLDFYQRKVLGIKETKSVEENIASNTFGTIIHETLRALYTPVKGKFLTEDFIYKCKENIEKQVVTQFQKYYSLRSIKTGKNYLTFEIAKQYVTNFLNFEVEDIRKGKKIKIIELEQDITAEHQVEALDFPIKLKGQIDRIDEVDGTLRIVDYKTGKVKQTDLNLKNWELLTTEEKYSKSLQVLLYAYMYLKNNPDLLHKQNMESGIISFKNFNEGFLKFNKTNISADLIEQLKVQLDYLILEIFNPDIPIQEKEIKTYTF